MSTDRDRQGPNSPRSTQQVGRSNSYSDAGGAARRSPAGRQPRSYGQEDETMLSGYDDAPPHSEERAPRQYKTLVGPSKSGAAIRGGATPAHRSRTLAMTQEDVSRASQYRSVEDDAEFYDDKTLSLSPDEFSALREEMNAQKMRRQPLAPQHSASFEDKTVALSLDDFPEDFDAPSNPQDPSDGMRATSNDDWIHVASQESSAPAPVSRRNEQPRQPARTMRFSASSASPSNTIPFLADIGYAFSARARSLHGEGIDPARERGGFIKLAMVGGTLGVLMLLSVIL